MLRSIGKQSGESVESVLMRQTNGQTDGRSTVTQTSLSINEWLQAATARASCVGATQHGRVSAEQQNWRRHQFVWSLAGAAAMQLEHGSTVRGYTEKTCRRRPHRPHLRVRLYSRKLPVNRSSSACRHIGRSDVQNINKLDITGIKSSGCYTCVCDNCWAIEYLLRFCAIML